ncbi:MAG: PKD domain-containing protein [Ekhidna sp.]|nr:PKD domain-containing protein [Ekhidna sp.]
MVNNLINSLRSVFSIKILQGGSIPLAGMLAILMFAASCGDDDDGPKAPEAVAEFSFEPAEPAEGDTVTFTDKSRGATKWAWDFGDSGTSTEQNPNYVYKTAGAKEVKLTINDGANEIMKTVTVAKRTPKITAQPDAFVAGDIVTLAAAIYNPDKKAVTYAWSPGDDSEYVDGTSTSSAEPKVIYSTAGEKTVAVTITIDGADFEGSTKIDVKAELAKTLYYTVVESEYNPGAEARGAVFPAEASGSGNVFSRKLTTKLESEAVNTNVSVKAHPYALRIANDRVYIFDAGAGTGLFGGTPGDPTMGAVDGDGEIKSFSLTNAADVTTHVTFSVPRSTAEGVSSGSEDEGHNRDPFYGDVTSTHIYWIDKRRGVYRVSLSTTDLAINTLELSNMQTLARKVQIAHYGETKNGEFNSLCGAFQVRNNNNVEELWWSLFRATNARRGIWRFVESDIKTDPLANDNTEAAPALGALFGQGNTPDHAPRAFAIDEANNKLYFAVNYTSEGGAGNTTGAGVYRSNLDGSNVETIDLSPDHPQGDFIANLVTSQIAVDAEGGYVYWSYIAPLAAARDASEPLQASNGIKRWKIDGTGEVEYFLTTDDDEFIYGIAIDQTKR